MSTFLGNDKVRVFIGGIEYNIEFYSENLITNGVVLLSADGYILQDVEGTYITAKEGDNG